MATTIQRLPRVLQDYGRSRSGLYQDIKEGLFPKPVSIGQRAVGWPSNEVQTIIEARIAGVSDLKLRELVQSLEAARKGQQQERGTR